MNIRMPKKAVKKTEANRSQQPPIHVPRGFELPKGLLNQINECSNGGFLLFYIDSTGNPQVAAQFDSAIHSLAMNTFIRYYANSAEDYQSGIVGVGEDQEQEGEDPSL